MQPNANHVVAGLPSLKLPSSGTTTNVQGRSTPSQVPSKNSSAKPETLVPRTVWSMPPNTCDVWRLRARVGAGHGHAAVGVEHGVLVHGEVGARHRVGPVDRELQRPAVDPGAGRVSVPAAPLVALVVEDHDGVLHAGLGREAAAAAEDGLEVVTGSAGGDQHPDLVGRPEVSMSTPVRVSDVNVYQTVASACFGLQSSNHASSDRSVVASVVSRVMVSPNSSATAPSRVSLLGAAPQPAGRQQDGRRARRRRSATDGTGAWNPPSCAGDPTPEPRCRRARGDDHQPMPVIVTGEDLGRPAD